MKASRRKAQPIVRVVAIAAMVATLVALVGTMMFDPLGGSGYSVWLRLENASQVIEGNDVTAGGAEIGSVGEIRLAADRQVDVKLEIDDPLHRPLHRGTRAVVRYKSLSGVVSRYVELRPPGVAERGEPIPDRGRIGAEKTTSAVEFDQLFATFDRPTREALRGVIQGFANQYAGRSAEARRGWLYLNPALVASTRLFQELNRDTPTLRAFVSASSDLVTDLASRRTDLAELVDHMATALDAMARRKEALAESISLLPPFMRRANTTFVEVRETLDDLRPLLREARPVAPKLRAFMARLRPFMVDARPAMRAFASLLRRPGTDNDLVELTRSAPPLRRIGVGPVTRNGEERPGALPVSTEALGQGVPITAFMRPYSVDFTAALDLIGHPRAYDALAGWYRGPLQVDVPALVPLPAGTEQQTKPGLGGTLVINQRNRCPLSQERGTVWKPSPDFPCDERQVPPGR